MSYYKMKLKTIDFQYVAMGVLIVVIIFLYTRKTSYMSSEQSLEVCEASHNTCHINCEDPNKKISNMAFCKKSFKTQQFIDNDGNEIIRTGNDLNEIDCREMCKVSCNEFKSKCLAGVEETRMEVLAARVN